MGFMGESPEVFPAVLKHPSDAERWSPSALRLSRLISVGGCVRALDRQLHHRNIPRFDLQIYELRKCWHFFPCHWRVSSNLPANSQRISQVFSHKCININSPFPDVLKKAYIWVKHFLYGQNTISTYQAAEHFRIFKTTTNICSTLNMQTLKLELTPNAQKTSNKRNWIQTHPDVLERTLIHVGVNSGVLFIMSGGSGQCKVSCGDII